MKVIEYLKSYSFEELKHELEKLFISNECCGFYNFTTEQWSTIYKAFNSWKNIKTTNLIHLNDRWDRSCPLIDMNCIVCNEDFDMISVLAMYPNLEEVMSMEVYVEVNGDITDKEIAAGLFWEITYIATEEKEQIIKGALKVKLKEEIQSDRVLVAVKFHSDDLYELFTTYFGQRVHYYDGENMPEYKQFYNELQEIEKGSILCIDNVMSIFSTTNRKLPCCSNAISNKPIRDLCLALIESNGICFHLVLGIKHSQIDQVYNLISCTNRAWVSFNL